MRILLPPSEAKHPAGAGPRLLPDRTPLGVARRRILTALAEFCRTDAAAAALALPARSAADELAANRAVRRSPTTAALDRYAGTVYLGLDAGTLSAAGRRKALESVLVFSGLFGVLSAAEPVPVYRLPVSAVLPPVGPLTRYWRSVLATELPALLGDGLIVDLRSSDYTAMWRPAGELRERTVQVRILSELPHRSPAVVSYPSKLGKGRLARALLARRTPARTVADVLGAWAAAGERDGVELTPGKLELLS
ncbi:MAG: peroxide stress protein YaaA [Jatrophihabitans sp.]